MDEQAFPGVDLPTLARWLAEMGLGEGPICQSKLLVGGTQNILVQFSHGGRSCVLRRPSLHPRPEAERTIEREATVLAALGKTNVPHPRLYAVCRDPAVLGASFYVMAVMDGFNATVCLTRACLENSERRHRLGLSLVDGIVQLAKVDYGAVGLAGFGKIEGFLDRQVSRWAAQLDSYQKFSNWSGVRDLEGVEQIGEWLQKHPPAGFVPGLMHGDYHLGNVLFSEEDETLTAILDWELATLGDPLLDLGRLIASWPDPDGNGPLSSKVVPWHGFPESAELISHYASGTGRDLRDLIWFEVLACYKLGIILEGTYARASQGLVDRETGARLHRSAIALIRRGLERLELEA